MQNGFENIAKATQDNLKGKRLLVLWLDKRSGCPLSVAKATRDSLKGKGFCLVARQEACGILRPEQ